MTQGTNEESRPPFAAYGPASAGYGPATTVTEPTGPAPGRPLAGPARESGWPGPAETFGVSPEARPRRALGIVALVLACLGALVAFRPSLWFLAWALLLTALVLAIVHLARRGSTHVAAVFALVIGIVGILIALIAALIAGVTASLAGSADPAVDDYTLAQRLVVADGDRSESPLELDWGVAAIVEDSETGAEVWSVRALTPVDITGETVDITPAPISVSGSFVAVPFEITNLSDAPIDPDAWQFRLSTDYLAPDGSTTDGVYDPGFMEEFPSRYDVIGPIEPGQSVVVYEVRDVAAAGAADGRAELWLYSGDSVTWTSAGDGADPVPSSMS